MKNYGKVTEYNGLYGKIKSVDGNNYTLIDKNIIDKDIKISDNVMFESEVHKTPEININVAKFVRVLKKQEPQNKK